MLTLPYTSPLARLYPGLDEVISVDTNRIRRVRGLLDPGTWIGYWRAYTRLRRERFDVAVSLSGPMASLWALLSGAGRTVGYSDEAYPFLLTETLAGGRYTERQHEVEYVRRLAVRAGGTAPEPRLRVSVPEGARAAADRLLSAVGITAQDKLVVIHAGSVNGSAKRWPPAYWGRFADEVQARTDARMVLVGAKSDRPIAEQVCASAATPLPSLVGRTSIEELIGLIQRADLVSTGDSGPLHLAVALERPLLAAYGPTDPKIHGPYHPIAPVALHRADIPCSPCYTMANSAECPLGDPVCMRLVTVDQMVESAIQLLG